MRRWAAILLILLVPMRVIAAGTMTCMFEKALAHAAAEASMPDECPMMKTGHAPGLPDPAPGHDGCSSCQLCMAFATPEPIPQVSASNIADGVAVAAYIPFRSAVVARALKPPIS
jgi:hypothetical protein